MGAQTYDWAATDPLLAAGGSLKETIASQPWLAEWLRAEADDCSLVGSEVNVFNSLKSGSTHTWTAKSSTQRPLLENDIIGGRSAARFDVSTFDYCSLNNPQLDFSTSHSEISLFLPNGTPPSAYEIWSSWTTGAGQTRLSYSGSGNFRYFHGDGVMTLPGNINSPNIFLTVWDGAATLSGRANGDAVANAAMPSGAGGTSTMRIGNLSGSNGSHNFDGWIREIMWISGNLLNAGNAGKLALLQRYFLDVYGLYL